MPWRESCAMDERVSFIADHTSGLWTMTELCERYEISRKSGYKWLDRYRQEGPAGLVERPHAPHLHGRATPQCMVDAIVGLRRERPSWGPRKIIGKLVERQPSIAWPTPSTAGAILKRAGLVCGRRVRRRAPPRLGELTVPQHANHVWSIDHKGWIRLRDGMRVEPLTVTDGFSRYLISLGATGSTEYAEAKPLIERAFREHGLPEVIRSDNGSPFASTGITGLTRLSVWWIKLGVRHERIDPGHP
jgi:putative transposase